MTRVVVDRTRCMSSGVCELAAPEVLEVGAAGVLRLLDPEPAMTEAVRGAVESCPTGALQLTG
jgi:ferredoxin